MLNPADQSFLERLRERLPDLTIREDQTRYLEEPRGKFAGLAGVVVAPSRTEDVAAIVKLAGEAGVGIVPYGGGTGLVGGQVQPDGPPPLVLSLERMARIRSVHADENVLVAEAGAIIADIQQAATEADRLFPLSYGAEGSARIGGALSVNSGGLNVLRYGTARDLCLGLEAVLPNGEIWNGLKRLRKDTSGYSLRNLLIGAEGTLGIITAASLRLFPRPNAIATALIDVPDPNAALALLSLTAASVGEAISAFELINGTGLDFLGEAGLDARAPFETAPEWSVLMEIGLTGTADPTTIIEALFADALALGHATDGVIASSEAQRAGLWRMREAIPEANKKIGAIASHDISLPLTEIADFIENTGASLRHMADVRINAFGHLGDGNLHYNVFPARGHDRGEYSDIADDITRCVHDAVAQAGGSFSAEHGIGRLKVAELERYGDPAGLAAMRAIKSALDPMGIMNPGAVLRPKT